MRRCIETHRSGPNGDLYAVTVHPGTQVRITAQKDVHFFKPHQQSDAVITTFTGIGPDDVFHLRLSPDAALDLLRVLLSRDVLPERLVAGIDGLPGVSGK